MLLSAFQEQWKSSTHSSKRRERSDDEDGGTNEKRRRKGGKRRKKDKHSKSHYDTEEIGEMIDEQENEDEDADINYREPDAQMNDDDGAEENAQGLLAAAGLEDSDVDDRMAAPSSISRRRQALSDSDDGELLERHSSPIGENSAYLQDSDGEVKDRGRTNEDVSDDEK